MSKQQAFDLSDGDKTQLWRGTHQNYGWGQHTAVDGDKTQLCTETKHSCVVGIKSQLWKGTGVGPCRCRSAWRISAA